MEGSRGSSQTYSDPLAWLSAAVDAVVNEDVDGRGALELLDRACELQRLSARLDAVRGRLLAATGSASDSRNVLGGLGVRNAAQAVAARTGAPTREVHATARHGTWVEDFPVFAAAAAEGVLTQRHLKELKALDRPNRPDRREALLASQDELVGHARAHDFIEFTHRLTVWLINHDTNGDDAKEQLRRTSCTVTQNVDGSIDGQFHLDPLSAALMIVAHGRCRTPGCSSPPSWIQTDHIQPHSRGGPTQLDNADPLCDPCNKDKADTDNYGHAEYLLAQERLQFSATPKTVLAERQSRLRTLKTE